jgi:large subunit ribosomal protein L17
VREQSWKLYRKQGAPGPDSWTWDSTKEKFESEFYIMRHRNAGFKLGRNTSHRRALLRNLVTSVIIEDRVETTVAKAKAVRPHVEKMITLGKKGDLHSRRQALSFLMTDKAVARLFDTVAPRYGDRQGGYLRIVRTGFQQGDGAEKAFIELLGAEKQLEVKRQKRADIKAKKRKELEDQLEAQKKEAEEKGGEEAA